MNILRLVKLSVEILSRKDAIFLTADAIINVPFNELQSNENNLDKTFVEYLMIKVNIFTSKNGLTINTITYNNDGKRIFERSNKTMLIKLTEELYNK